MDGMLEDTALFVVEEEDVVLVEVVSGNVAT